MKLPGYAAALTACLAFAFPAWGQITAVSDEQPGNISGTVTDGENDVIPGATVVLDGPASSSPRTMQTTDNGAFAFTDVPAGGPYHVTVRANGFAIWSSQDVVVNPGQFVNLLAVNLTMMVAATSVTVYASPEQIATEQMKLEEKQRVLGLVPNFYVSYDPDPAPLTAKMKFSLALRAETDPVTFLGAAAVAGMDQAGDTPNYPEGAQGFGERLGANYTTGLTDIMIGGAILPSVLHQDPRYFYKGTGTTMSRVLHALSAPFICRGDNGRLEPNYSSLGGDLAAGAISNAYYPSEERGVGPFVSNDLITTGGRMVNGLIQEFLLRGITTGGRNPQP